MVFAGIVAGGKGTRIPSADRPKQFLPIGGVPVIVRTVRRFIETPGVDQVIVGINPGWRSYTERLFQEWGLENVILVDGGRDRNGTVLNILAHIRKLRGIVPGDVLVTHDAVRPFVTEGLIRDNIDTAREKLACGTYIPSEDTVIRSPDGETVKENLVRSELYRAQTPQSFEIAALCRCISRLGEEEVSRLTDTCGIMTACGIPIAMVRGEPGNFKITTEYDLKIAELIAGTGS